MSQDHTLQFSQVDATIQLQVPTKNKSSSKYRIIGLVLKHGMPECQNAGILKPGTHEK